MRFEPTPEKLSLEVRDAILADMNPSQLAVHSKLSCAVMLGGMLSLLFCGQFGFGMTPWAETMSHQLHQQMSSVTCALICGVLYALFPTFILRMLLCSPLQFRIILKKNIGAALFWYSLVGATLAYHGDHGQGIVELSTWILAALGTSHLLAWAFTYILKSWSFPDLLRRA